MKMSAEQRWALERLVRTSRQYDRLVKRYRGQRQYMALLVEVLAVKKVAARRWAALRNSATSDCRIAQR